jgi:hypothetical protein
LHQYAYGSGNGSMYEVVRYVGIRIMDVKMTGKLANRYVLVQPCQIVDRRAIVNPAAPHTHYIYAAAITR